MPSSNATWFTHPVVATIVGVLAAGLTVLLVESAGHAMFGTGDLASRGGITTTQYIAVYIAWILGAGVGALVATRWARTSSVLPGVIVALCILAGAVANIMAMPHPLWLIIASASLPLVGLVVARSVRGGRPHAGAPA